MFDLTLEDWMRDWKSPPNLVSFTRLFLAVPVCIWLFHEGALGWISWSLLFIAVWTDKLDGWLAKRNGGKLATKLGKVIDPYIDKTLTLAVLVTACFKHEDLRTVLVWVTVLVTLREVNVIYVRLQRPIESAAEPGRFSMVAQSTALLWVTLPISGSFHQEVATNLLVFGTGASLCSGWGYTADWYRSILARALAPLRKKKLEA